MDKLRALLGDLFEEPPEQIDDEAPFADIGEWDSLKYMRLVLGIEAAFGCELGPEEIQSLTSVSEIKRVLDARGVAL